MFIHAYHAHRPVRPHEKVIQSLLRTCFFYNGENSRFISINLGCVYVDPLLFLNRAWPKSFGSGSTTLPYSRHKSIIVTLDLVFSCGLVLVLVLFEVS